jgi:CheY-like chemotaxis protein
MLELSPTDAMESGLLQTSTFPYRVLIVDDEPRLRELGRHVLESQGYEVLCAEDGFEALAALKQSLPDMIISDLQMPNMSGFEFLSVVRQRFPAIPVIVISGEFAGLSVPETVLADAFFPKGGYKPPELFEKISELLQVLPARKKVQHSHQAAVWVNKNKGTIIVTCSHCLRTFPLVGAAAGVTEAECDFCGNLVRFEIVEEQLMN